MAFSFILFIITGFQTNDSFTHFKVFTEVTAAVPVFARGGATAHTQHKLPPTRAPCGSSHRLSGGFRSVWGAQPGICGLSRGGRTAQKTKEGKEGAGQGKWKGGAWVLLNGLIKRHRKKMKINGKRPFVWFSLVCSVPKKMSKKRKLADGSRKLVQPIPLDSSGRPVFPIVLGGLTVYSLGEIITDRMLFHDECAIYPVGFCSTRVFASMKNPDQQCLYTCQIKDGGTGPQVHSLHCCQMSFSIRFLCFQIKTDWIKIVPLLSFSFTYCSSSLKLSLKKIPRTP